MLSSESSDQLHPHFSVDEIAKIMTVLMRHSNEDPCIHRFDQIMQEAFET